MLYILLLLLYFLIPTGFYFYTISKSKKYDRSKTWCENALKLHRPQYVALPLLLIGMISVMIFATGIYTYSLYSIFFLTLLFVNITSYILWVTTIFTKVGTFHLLIGFVYVISLAMMSLNFVLIDGGKTIWVIFLLTALLNLLMGMHLVFAKKPATIHEEIQAICFTLYHLVVVLMISL